MLKINITYPERDEEMEIINRMTAEKLPESSPVIGESEIKEAKSLIHSVYVDDKIMYVFTQTEPGGLSITPKIKRLIVNIISHNLSSLSEPCFYPEVKKHLYELLRLTGLTERDIKEFTKRRWKGRKEAKFMAQSDPIAMYLADIFTVHANLAGIPAISIPNGKDAQGLSIGLQLMGREFEEAKLLAFSNYLLKQNEN